MKYLPFRIIALCIFLPSILYLGTLQVAETYFKSQYVKEIEDNYLGDVQILLDGQRPIREVIRQHIDTILEKDSWIRWGVEVDVTVVTKGGTWLYPSFFQDETDGMMQSDPIQVAAQNYQLINQGLVVNTKVEIKYNSVISYALMICYIGVSAIVLFYFYRRAMRKVIQEEVNMDRELESLRETEKNYQNNLEKLSKERNRLMEEAHRLKTDLEKEKDKATRNEEEMINEIISLEDEIEKTLELQQEQQGEIESLKAKIQQLEKKKKKDIRQKQKESETVRKRFRTLYKNLHVHDRAISGYLDLTEDMRIKAEEVIHQLNESPDVVTIKRKVFGGKGMETVLEVLFSYNGRLYFRKSKENRIEVLTIGTKNNQAKDLEFLKKLSSG